jgi:hypothetical protein
MNADRDEMPWTGAGGCAQAPWRKELHRDPARRDALAETKPPERPDYDLQRRSSAKAGAANRFLIKARRGMANQHNAS